MMVQGKERRGQKETRTGQIKEKDDDDMEKGWRRDVSKREGQRMEELIRRKTGYGLERTTEKRREDSSSVTVWNHSVAIGRLFPFPLLPYRGV